MSLSVYFINLDQDTERRDFMEKQLSGVNYERVAGFEAVGDPDPTARLKPAERACIAAHREAWRRFLASDASFACFLEDDVHLTPNFFALIAGSDWIPPDAHAVKIDSYFQRVMLSDRRTLWPGLDLALLETLHESSAGYILSRAGAETYLRITEAPTEPVDRLLFPHEPRAKGFRIWQVSPAALLQDHLLSDENPAKRNFSTKVQAHRLNRVRKKLSAAERWRKIKRETARIGDQSIRGVRALRRQLFRGLRWKVVGFDETVLRPPGQDGGAPRRGRL